MRGKPLNTCSAKRDTLYNNKEFYDLIKLVQRIQDEESEVSDE